MKPSARFEDMKFPITRTFNAIEEKHGYATGTVYTPLGMVRVYTEPSVTNLTFVKSGVEYRRVWRRGYKPRYIVTLANRFIGDIFDDTQAGELCQTQADC
jgi:hypothetical protein